MNLFNCLLLLFFAIETPNSEAKNYFENELFSVILDLHNPDPVLIHFTNVDYDAFEVSVNDRDDLKIGEVRENGVLIYSDSDLLFYRKVVRMYIRLCNRYILQIFSIYKYEDGKTIKEYLELQKELVDFTYREIIKEALTLNLNYRKRNSYKNIIVTIFKGNSAEGDLNNSDMEVFFKSKNKFLYMITTIKYDEIIIDNTVNVVYKNAFVKYKGDEIEVEVNKVTKNAEYVNYKCKIIFEGPNSRCQETERTEMDVF